MGTQESVYYGVPMLCIPLLADQWTNAYNYVKLKIATLVDFGSVSQKQFDSALDDILNNPLYRYVVTFIKNSKNSIKLRFSCHFRENMEKTSRIFRDRPQSAMETAAFWIEFVVRNGKDSLRSPAMDLNWWQISLLDVFAVAILGLLVCLFSIIFILKKLIKLVCCIFCRKTNLVKRNKKQN